MKITEHLDAARVRTAANIYFDGKCVSHQLQLADGRQKSIGVIFPAVLTFNTDAPEVMECVAGRCRVRIRGQEQWHEYGPGQSFSAQANSSFDIEVFEEPLHYICHYG